jgi:hypothetical protein
LEPWQKLGGLGPKTGQSTTEQEADKINLACLLEATEKTKNYKILILLLWATKDLSGHQIFKEFSTLHHIQPGHQITHFKKHTKSACCIIQISYQGSPGYGVKT